MRITLLLLVIAAFSPAIAETWSLMRFTPVCDGDIQRFSALGFDPVMVYADASCDFVASDTERMLLLRSGLQASCLVPDMTALYSSQYREPITMGGFQTWTEVQSWMDSLHAANPGITSSPTSIGNTYEGRPQLVMKLSSNNSFSADDPSMPNAWYDGLIHSREGASLRNIQYWMMWLCSNHGRNGFCGYQADWILENREIWCLPVNNIDGWVYNQTQSPGGGGMHRKNRNLSAGGSGIDLNRNWSVGWGGAGSSGDPSSETYRGTGPLSEPEAANIDAFWQAHPPAQMHSTHAYANALIYPWGWTDDPTTHAAQYTTQGEIMVTWGTGEDHYPSTQFYYASGNTRDHSYGLYGAMSWNHETGASFAGFWPSADEVIRLSRRNLRSYLVTACLAGRPYDPQVPGVPVMEEIGMVSGSFTVDWSDAANASSYALQRLSGYLVPLDDTGDSGPFNKVNWIMTGAQYHSPGQCYRSNGTGAMTWQQTVTIPPGGGGRLSFWSMQNIVPESYQGAFSYSSDGGANWYYLQTFGRNDMTWRLNIHELDEWQGKTLSFRWESYGPAGSCALYIDDIKVEVWDANTIQADGLGSSQHTVSGLPLGDHWFRAWAVDDSFGPGWPGEPVHAQVVGVGVEDASETVVEGSFLLGLVTPSPVRTTAIVPVCLGGTEGVSLVLFDVAGRVVEDLTPCLTAGNVNIPVDVRTLRAGIYFVRLSGPAGVRTARMTVLP